MNDVLRPPLTKQEPRQRFVLHHVSWDNYEKICDVLNEQHVRTTDDRGELELMSPLLIHETVKVWFGHLILALAMELNVSYREVGGPTIRRRVKERGLEPGDCFYFAAMEKVQDWKNLNLDRDPPPDLALEIDITNSSLDRLSAYAGLGVPEVWLFDGEDWHVHVLGTNAAYWESPSSVILPYLPINELSDLLQQTAYVGNVLSRLDLLRKWVRERVLPLYEEWKQQNPPPGVNP